MKHLVVILSSAAVFLTLTISNASIAAEPIRVEGRNCTAADRGAETWFGYFKGKRDLFLPLKSGDASKTFTRWRCFEAEVECTSWTYWMQTDFPADSNEAFCRQGG